MAHASPLATGDLAQPAFGVGGGTSVRWKMSATKNKTKSKRNQNEIKNTGSKTLPTISCRWCGGLRFDGLLLTINRGRLLPTIHIEFRKLLVQLRIQLRVVGIAAGAALRRLMANFSCAVSLRLNGVKA